MAKNYRHSGLSVSIVSASGAIASGALVFQEGEVGIAKIPAASGASLEIQRTGTFVIPVPSGTVKGDNLYNALSGESVALTLTKTATAAYYIGTAEGDRDANGNALVHLNPQLGVPHA